MKNTLNREIFFTHSENNAKVKHNPWPGYFRTMCGNFKGNFL